MPIHHLTSYGAILGVTEVRLWEVATKGGAWLGTASVWFRHARCQTGLARTVCTAITVASLGNVIDHSTVVGSLMISPVPSVARAGVAVAGMGGALSGWLIFVMSAGTYSWLSHKMSESPKTAKCAAKNEGSLWGRLLHHAERPHGSI